ncbi:ubiquitin-specific protease otu1 [Sarracenia purpurea var. burkii]
MKNQEGILTDAEMKGITPIQASIVDDWENFRDDDIMQQQSAIRAEEAEKIPFVGDKEPLSSLAAEYQSGSPILLEKIKILSEQFAAIRRTRGDGNCFFRSFMFSFLEHILEAQDREEVNRLTANVENCRKTLQSLGYADFTFEDFFALFLEQLESVLQGNEASISHDELLQRSRDQSISDYVVMFFRFVTSGEIRKRSEFFEPFILGLTNATVEQFCKSAVEPMGEESDHVHITALSDALGVPIRVVYLDRSSCDTAGVSVNHHDFIPAAATDIPSATVGGSEAIKPFITLLYRPGKGLPNVDDSGPWSIGSLGIICWRQDDNWKRRSSSSFISSCFSALL